MNLQPVDGQSGLWRNPAWAAGTPGIFAIVIGVSDYSHLRADANSLHMGKLHVSALTAYRFFEWLGNQYRLDGVPLATCRLLLAPTAEETEQEAGLVANSLAPTYSNCEQNILDWFHEMDTLPVTAAEQSRSMFFFSGHGLEVTEEMQILLPQDYLRPPVPQYNRAIGTNNLRRGLKALKVARHFVFLDACRNDHENLKQQDAIEGERILNPVIGVRRNPRCLVPLFFASAAGEQAFQPVDPRQGVSLFGRALLEGLGAVGLEPTCDDRRCVVNLDPLLGYCKQRIPQLAKVEFGQDLEQEVRLSGDYVQDPVTEVTRSRALPPTALSISENRAPRLSVRPTVPPGWRPESFGDAHIVFGSERVTDPFVNDSRVYSYSQKQWLGRGKDFVIPHVSHAVDRTLYEVDLELSQPQQRGACWFEISDSVRRFGMVLPPTQQSVRYRLEFEMAFDHT